MISVLLSLMVINGNKVMMNGSFLFPFLEWSREALLEKWMKDPVQCCQLAGVQPPTSALQHCSSEPSAVTLEYNNSEPTNAIQQQGMARTHGETIVSILLLLF
jgi:hypothetical protein